MSLLLTLLTGCQPVQILFDGERVDATPDTGPTDTGPADTADTSTDTADTADTAETGETAEPFTYDCDDLPAGPIAYETLYGFTTSEDFTFDGEGHLIGVQWNGNLVAVDYDGTYQVIAPGLAQTAGTSMLADGDAVIANPATGAIYRVGLDDGGRETMAGGIDYPNGVTVAPDGMVYISGHTRGFVYELNPDTQEMEVIAGGMYAPNGIALSPDGDTIYTCSFGTGAIYAMDRTDDGWSEPRTWAQVGGGGWNGGALDGLNVDACGNVYVTEYISGRIYRFSEEGAEAETLVNLPSSWIPNLHWGTGEGGFEEGILYVADREQGRLFALDVGVPTTPQGFVP